MLVKLMEELESVPEGSGTMMDNTLIVYTSNNADKQHTSGANWPVMLLGNYDGAFKTGQFTQLDGKRPINALYTTILRASGVPCDRFNMSEKMAAKFDSGIGTSQGIAGVSKHCPVSPHAGGLCLFGTIRPVRRHLHARRARSRETSNFAQGFLDKHCLECHDDLTVTEGDLSLLDLGPVDETNAATWKSVWAQVTLQEMPPKKKPQPDIVERLRFSDWIVGELQRVMADKGGFHAHLDPKKGNYVDHDLLFGPLPEGIRLVPTSSPARIWRVTPQEHITRLNELINTEPNSIRKSPACAPAAMSFPPTTAASSSCTSAPTGSSSGREERSPTRPRSRACPSCSPRRASTASRTTPISTPSTAPRRRRSSARRRTSSATWPTGR